MRLKDIPNKELIEYFEDAVRDNNYNPTSKDYNQSGYTYHELYEELYNRMGI
jgi:hypothetical protein